MWGFTNIFNMQFPAVFSLKEALILSNENEEMPLVFNGQHYLVRKERLLTRNLAFKKFFQKCFLLRKLACIL